MSAPGITVLMPAYNVAPYIGEAIQSVLEQTFPDFELLIINDCSKDDTLKVAAGFDDPRIRILSNPQNLGLIKTLNRGIREARGRYIARLDSDDAAYPKRLERQFYLLERDSELGLVTGWTEVIDERGRTKGFGNWAFAPEEIYYILHFRNCMTHSSAMFRRDLVLELGGYPEEAVKTEDFALWGKISQKAKVHQVQEVLVKWREHSGGVSSSGAKEMEEQAHLLCRQRIKEVTGLELSMDMVRAMVECGQAARLDKASLREFSEVFPRTVQGILNMAPSYCRKAVLEQYAEVELVKYANILSKLGMKTHWSGQISLGRRLLGLGYYLTRYRHIYRLERFLPKSHF